MSVPHGRAWFQPCEYSMPCSVVGPMTLLLVGTVAADDVVLGSEVVVDAGAAGGRREAAGPDAQHVVLDDVAVGAGAVVLDGVGVVADVVAVGQVGRADEVVVGTGVEDDREVAEGGIPPGLGEADPVPDDAVVVGIGTVEQDAPVDGVDEQPADGVAHAGDVEADLPGAVAVAPDLDPGHGVGADRAAVDRGPRLAVAVDGHGPGAAGDVGQPGR